MSDITLPPSPVPPEMSALYDKAGGKGTAKALNLLLEQYAIAAIELDRQGRGEPVAWMLTLPDGRVTLEKTFPAWAQDGDGYAIQSLYTAPQPAAPTVKESLTVAEPAQPAVDWEVMYDQMCERCSYLDGKLAEYEDQPASNATLRDLIANDAYAASFQTMGQYRQALLRSTT